MPQLRKQLFMCKTVFRVHFFIFHLFLLHAAKRREKFHVLFGSCNHSVTSEVVIDVRIC